MRFTASFEPLRILFVHERRGDFGGAESNIRVTATALAQRGHETGLYHGEKSGQALDLWDDAFSWQGESASLSCAGAIEAFQPDAIYIHKMEDPGILSELQASGLPVVRMVHDHDLYCMRSYKYDPLSRKICPRPASAYCVFPCLACVGKNPGGSLPVKWQSLARKKEEIALNRKFTRMIVAGEFMKGELVKNGFDASRIEIHPPVPVKSTTEPAPSQFKRNLVLYVGQLIRGKGVDVLLESLALVKTPFECIIVGEGSHREYCQELAKKLGLADRVTFTGFVAQDQLQNFFLEASVMAVSSVWPEPFGMTGLEAMRHSLPVVAFDAGGIKEWLADQENGILVPWMDRTAYAAAVDSLLTDKEAARKMGLAGKVRAQENFSFDHYIDGLEDLFTRVSDRSSAAIDHNHETLHLAEA